MRLVREGVSGEIRRVMRQILASLLLLASLGGTNSLIASGPFLEVAVSGSGTNLLKNPDFQLGTSAGAQAWSAAPNGYSIGDGHNSTRAVTCDAPDDTGWRGVSQWLSLNRTNTAPILIRGWSRAESVSGGSDSGYSIYVDLVYDDGTPLWGQTANFSTGTHVWQSREVLVYPERPVKSLTVYCLFRGHSGRVWFDDISLTELTASGGAFVYQGAPMFLSPQTNAPPAAGLTAQTEDGLKLGFAGSRVVSVKLDDRELAPGSPGGFLARDIGTNSHAYGFENGECGELGLRLEAQTEGRANHVSVRGKVTNLAGGDRAMLLVFALPVDMNGGIWEDDARRTRPIGGTGEYNLVNSVGCGTTGAMSQYPLGCVRKGNDAIALALDMARPAVYRVTYHAGAKQLLIAFDLGLVPETKSPGSAEFGFVIYRADARWGFRSALAKLQAIYPEYFQVRSTNQGIWMPFTDVSTVQGWQDFGFRYHEGDNNVSWDDANQVLSFRYTEPTTWWMSMAPELPRTVAEALRVRDEYANGAAGYRRTMAQVSRTAAMLDEDRQPAMVFRNEPWANGAVWSLNPNPNLPAQPNAATVYWNDAARAKYTATSGPKLDGEYLDSLEGYVTANLNYNREHFKDTTVPVTFTADTREPVLFKGLAIFEFTKWMSEEVHGLGGLMFANSVPYRFSFLCPWLDVMGTETDWMPGGVYTPVSDAQMLLWRSMTGAKPYLLLMNTDYSRFTPEYVERYFLRSLAFGIYPSMFSHNAAENPYWGNPDWYNRDRNLFKKYLPIIKEVAEAGWEPVTAARLEGTGLPVERFGKATARAVYFTLLNDASTNFTGVLTVEPEQAPTSAVATEIVSGTRLGRSGSGWSVTIPARSTAVVKLQKGPSFSSIEKTAGGLRVTVDSPTELEQVMETTSDLKEWTALLTNRPSEPGYTVDLAPAADQQFLRLRW